ncbi:MAG TPA: inverse autotransporter beta domain-containing protein, partial [Aurantimonas sp.]|nr:inverse autotransporter beta domain-containing protein [Aurantimonas sp.]
MASTCLAALVCVTAGGSAGAQDRPAASGPLWGAHADIVGRTAQEHSAAGVEFFIPLLQNQDSMIFIDAGINGDFDSEVYGTFGLGYRKIVTPDLILGGIVAVDVTRTDDENTFGAISLGAEAIGTSAEARINVQLPFSGARRIFDETVAISQPGTLTLLDNRLVEQAANRRITVDEVPLSGVEGEIGVNLPIGFDRLDDQLKAFAGAYHYGGDGVDSFTGVSGRLEYSVRDIMGDKLPGAELILSAGLTHDDEHGTNFAGEARLRIPLGAPVRTAANARTLSPLEERMTQRVVRTTRIHTSERTRSQVGSFAPRVVTDPLTGRPLEAIYFADGADKFGKGTADDPTTLADAVQRAGAGGTVVAEGNNGTIDTPGVALASGQRLVGGGVAIPVQLADGTITSFQLGQIAPVIVGVPTANTITLAANNRLQSLTITGGLNGIAGTNVEALALQQATIGGSAVAGISIVNDAGTNTLSVDGLSVSGVGGPGVAVNGLGGGSTTVTGFSGVTVASAGGGGVLFDGVTFDADRRMPGFQRVAAGGLTIGDQTNPAAIRGDGLRLNQVAGDLAFTSLLIANADGAGLFIRDSGGPGGDFSFGNTGGAIRTAGGAALDVDPVLLAARFGTVSSINAARQGSGGADGVFLDRILARDSGAPALVIDTLSISGAAGNGLVATNNAGNLVFGATSITNVGGTGIVLANNAGTVTFADTAIANPGAGGIDIAGINGRVGFGNVDITGLGAGKGLDLTDAAGYASTRVALAFQTLDITGTGVVGSVGIDYSGTTNIFDVTTADSGRISGVGIGIDLRNAAATGLFQYGDGSAADADGRASLITAARPLEIAGLNAATGLYNLRDVAFAGDISNISGVTVFYVDADGGNNPAIADGTAEDPGTLAQAAASGADVIALVDNQIAGQNVIDAGAAIQGAPGSLTLGDGQRLISFLNEDLVDTGGGRGVPANLLLTGIDANIVRNPRTGSGAPRLTTTEGGRNTLVLGNNNTLTGVVIDNGAGAAAVFGNGIGGLTFRNSQLSSIGLTATGGTGRLENLAIGQLAVTGGSIALVGSNADIAHTGSSAALSVGGGHTGSITFDAASSISASSGIGLRFNQANGIYDFGGPFTLGGGANIAFSGAAGRLSFADTTIGNPVGNGIDLAGTNGAISFGNVAISGVAAGAVALDFNGAALTGAFSARSLVATGAGGTPPAGSIGIDLRGVTGGQTIRIGVSSAPDPAADTPSRLENFATGVFVDAASNAVFTYGDGEDAADRASRIRATTPINAASAPTLGSYNFLDVDFEGASPGAGFVPATVYYFSETGTGTGATQSDPGSIGGAEASGADLLVPIGTTTINAANGGGGGSLDLASAQQLRGFDTAGGTLAAGFTGPPTIQISALSATISDV